MITYSIISNVSFLVPPTINLFENSEGISSHEFAFNCIATALPPAKYDFYKVCHLRMLAEDFMIDKLNLFYFVMISVKIYFQVYHIYTIFTLFINY